MVIRHRGNSGLCFNQGAKTHNQSNRTVKQINISICNELEFTLVLSKCLNPYNKKAIEIKALNLILAIVQLSGMR
jgi:hypothetical protein